MDETQKKRGRPKAELSEADAMPVPPRISVIDRRLKNPFGMPSREIPLKGEKRTWVCRTFYASPENPNRHYNAVNELGWVPLKKTDLAVEIEAVGYVENPSGYLVRGEGGKEMLMAMPKEDFDRVQKAKSDANTARLKKSSVREGVAQAAGKEHGDQAGASVYKHFEQTEVQETITVGGNGPLAQN